MSTSNSGVTDISNSTKLLVRDNNTLQIHFVTHERIIGTDNSSHGPKVIFFWDNQTRTADSITGTKDNFTATYTIKTSEANLEKDIDYRITIHDPSGNKQEYQNSAGLISKTSSSGKSFRLDTVAPEINVVRLSTDNQGILDSDRQSTLIARDNNTLTLNFTTNERLIGPADNDSRMPEVKFYWDNETQTRSAIVTGTNDNFTATYTIQGGGFVLNDTDLQKDLDYRITIHDPSGNRKQYLNSAGLKIDTIGKRFRIDTTKPSIQSIDLSTDNHGVTDPDRATTLMVRDNNTLTLSFHTDERIIGTDHVSLKPQIEIFWDNGTLGQIRRSADTITVDNTSVTAVYRIKAEDSGHEADMDYRILIHDPAGNKQEYVQSNALTGVVVNNQLRIDTLLPEISYVELSTNNQGVTDPDRLSTLLIRDNDTLSVRFSTGERVIGIDNVTHGPEVVFFWDNQTRTADNITGLKDNFTAVYRIKSSESDLQKDIDYRITIHDPAETISNIEQYSSFFKDPVFGQRFPNRHGSF